MSTSRKYPAVFLDRDGVINEEVGYVDDLQKLRLIPCAYQAIQLINQSGLKAVVVSNQAGVAKGILSEKWVRQTNQYLDNLLRQRGAFISKFYFCPHHPTEGIEPYRKICDCRKPAPGMFLKAARELNIDLSRSYMIGDRFWDVEAAKKCAPKGYWSRPVTEANFSRKMAQIRHRKMSTLILSPKIFLRPCNGS